MAALTDIGYIRDLLGRHGFRFSKALGQNFLVNPTVCRRFWTKRWPDWTMPRSSCRIL